MADISTLQPALQPWARWILENGRRFAGRMVVTSALRSRIEQKRLYDRYLLGQSNIPANPPGTSEHETGWAFDLATAGVDPFDDKVLPWLGKWWSYYGGYYAGPRDPVHFGVRRA